MAACKVGSWQKGIPVCVAPMSFDPGVMAATSLVCEGPRGPARVPRPPPGEEVPWPVRLVQAVRSENSASSDEASAFQPKSKTQRRREQRAFMQRAGKVTTRQGVPVESRPVS
ncbi:unnamed protein product [Prorocentrum cordatum]|uniref:Ribosome biogenesis protein NOP53 n=1 Tax=Prorocentrum cordatum TaxID=2364126 RepID=A0ABN9SA06_9DINO|nr:unnamed protein product [Polarella glacialis]